MNGSMKVFLDRTGEKDVTWGKLTLPSGTVLHTLELVNMQNKPFVSCIPVGTYNVVPYKSKKFGEVYMLENVPDRAAILMHAGNYIGDTQGCILVAMRKGKSNLLASKQGMDVLREEIGCNPFTLVIR